MTSTVTVLVPSVQLTAAQTDLFTAGTVTKIDKFTATNTSGASATLTVHLVNSGDGANATNTIVSQQSIAPNATYEGIELEGHALDAGDILTVQASVSGALTVRAAGREIT